MCLQFDDLSFHFLLRLVNLRQFYLSFLEVHRVLVQQLQLLLGHVLEALALVGVESVVLPEPVSQLSPFCLQLLNFSLKLAALRLVILELLLLRDFDFLEVEAEVLGHAVQLPQDFVLGHDILHIGADLVVLFGELVEIVVGDGCLVADVLGVHQQRGVLVLARHLLQPQRQLRNHRVLGLDLLLRLLPQQFLFQQFILQFLQLVEGLRILLLELGPHFPDVLGDDLVDVVDGLPRDDEFAVEAIAFLSGKVVTA